MQNIKISQKMPLWRLIPVAFLKINDVIMTTPLVLNILYMLANFLILSIFKYFTLCVYFDADSNFANKFTNMTS